MCTYKDPFEATNDGAIMKKILTQPEPNEPIPDIYSPQLKQMVNWLLTKDHEERPSVLEVLRSDCMAVDLRDQGYDPRLIGVANKNTMIVIKKLEEELSSVQNDAQKEIEIKE